MPHNQSKLHTATQAEILRSHQRDTDFVAQISDNATDILHRYGLYRTFSKFAKSEVPARLFYFLATSGIGNQTLGEEYTGIVQANLKRQKIPSLLVRGQKNICLIKIDEFYIFVDKNISRYSGMFWRANVLQSFRESFKSHK